MRWWLKPDCSSSSAWVASRNSRSAAPSKLDPTSCRSCFRFRTVNGTAAILRRDSAFGLRLEYRRFLPGFEQLLAEQDDSLVAEDQLVLLDRVADERGLVEVAERPHELLQEARGELEVGLPGEVDLPHLAELGEDRHVRLQFVVELPRGDHGV